MGTQPGSPPPAPWTFCLVISIQDLVNCKALLIPGAELLLKQCNLGMESPQFVLISQAFYTHSVDSSGLGSPGINQESWLILGWDCALGVVS